MVYWATKCSSWPNNKAVVCCLFDFSRNRNDYYLYMNNWSFSKRGSLTGADVMLDLDKNIVVEFIGCDIILSINHIYSIFLCNMLIYYYINK